MPLQLLHEGRQVASSAHARTDAYQKNRAELEKLLACSVSAEALQSLFWSKMAYFFIQGDYAWLSANIDNVCRGIRAANLPSSMVPSKPDITALSKHGALTLPAILRLNRVPRHLQIRSEVRSSRAPLIAKGSVIPSIRYVDPEVIAKLRNDSNKSERELIVIMNRYIQSLENVDRGDPNPFPMYFFSDKLQKGVLLGVRGTKHYRITTATAMAICHACLGTSDRAQLKVECDMYFPEKHTLGSGNGMYTVALPRNYGNQLYFY